MAEFDMNVMRQVLYGDGVEKLFAFGYCGFYVFDPLTPGSGTWTKLVENFEIAAAVPADASEGYFMMDMAFSVSNPGLIDSLSVIHTMGGKVYSGQTPYTTTTTGIRECGERR